MIHHQSVKKGTEHEKLKESQDYKENGSVRQSCYRAWALQKGGLQDDCRKNRQASVHHCT